MPYTLGPVRRIERLYTATVYWAFGLTQIVETRDWQEQLTWQREDQILTLPRPSRTPRQDGSTQSAACHPARRHFSCKPSRRPMHSLAQILSESLNACPAIPRPTVGARSPVR